jgi:hypothetical protein
MSVVDAMEFYAPVRGVAQQPTDGDESYGGHRKGTRLHDPT